MKMFFVPYSLLQINNETFLLGEMFTVQFYMDSDFISRFISLTAIIIFPVVKGLKIFKVVILDDLTYI